MNQVNMESITIEKPVRAIVQFGPATSVSGFRAGEYYQCTIDPDMVSPSGSFIRFDQSVQGGEMHGWQRVEAMTVCEVLGDAEGKLPDGCARVEGAKVVMRALA